MTALQELIKIIKQKRKESEISNTLLRFVHDEAEKLLETEKQQISNAWLSAWKDSMLNPLEDKYYQPEAEQYFNETYKK